MACSVYGNKERKADAMYDLKALEGDLIKGVFFPLDVRAIKEVRLHRVEAYGIWIESQEITEKLLTLTGKDASEQTLVFFLPWSQIGLIAAAVAVPSFSERALRP